MKQLKKYLLAFFLTATFMMQEAGSLIPGLFLKDGDPIAAMVADTDQESKKENNEEKGSERVKEPYWHHTAFKNTCPVLSLKGYKISARDLIYTTAVYISISTLPPETV